MHFGKAAAAANSISWKWQHLARVNTSVTKWYWYSIGTDILFLNSTGATGKDNGPTPSDGSGNILQELTPVLQSGTVLVHFGEIQKYSDVRVV